MRAFTDTTGRKWELTINVGQVRAVRDRASFDLSAAITDKFVSLANLVNDQCKFCEVLFTLCREQAEKLGVNNKQFEDAQDADSLNEAADAFLHEFAEKMVPKTNRQNFLKYLAKAKEVGEMLSADASKAIETIDPRDVISTLRKSLMTSPGSSE